MYLQYQASSAPAFGFTGPGLRLGVKNMSGAGGVLGFGALKFFFLSFYFVRGLVFYRGLSMLNLCANKGD